MYKVTKILGLIVLGVCIGRFTVHSNVVPHETTSENLVYVPDNVTDVPYELLNEEDPVKRQLILDRLDKESEMALEWAEMYAKLYSSSKEVVLKKLMEYGYGAGDIHTVATSLDWNELAYTTVKDKFWNDSVSFKELNDYLVEGEYMPEQVSYVLQKFGFDTDSTTK